MNYSLAVLDWHAIAPGVSTSEAWCQWASQPAGSGFKGEIEKSQRIPMMLARRMSPVSRLAVEAALVLLEKHQVDRAVFISRHGELERTYKILQALAQEEQVSPTDFSMSVHNTAAGWMTIAAKNALPVTSLTAGKDSFQQGLIEARAMLSVEGVENVLLIDFDGIVPAPYDDASSEDYSPYCVAFILALGNQLTCQRSTEKHINLMPQSLIFLRNFLLENAAFSIGSATGQWQWQRTD
ncbi:beta-ketoacyl synthase chain length factor [Rouxiella silvae]|uniref:Beta-ketoacyl synthase chain length factor n=1 Tax=Rouxiella silvae TaxID=1646373 RepID=A0AA40X2K0_9GAMM|nr:beta-ketoacyl synthase chain length factor [Rouxiella silvae]MBF6637007.1 beta-ketoacyl synthase chain length factor [Rouxiella silvae]